jgi:hypothetical protein
MDHLFPGLFGKEARDRVARKIDHTSAASMKRLQEFVIHAVEPNEKFLRTPPLAKV